MPKSTNARADGPDDQRRLAVLIDADNVQPAVIEGLLAEVAKFGVASVKRIYGNWTSDQMGQWKARLLRHSLNPVQQFAYTSGKNATDSSLIIDAMDLMYTRRFDGFCLVSSDSDFTRLAQRLREEGLTVYGFGERKTPEAFVAACDKFVYTELLRPAVSTPQVSPSAPAPAPARGRTAKAAKAPGKPPASVGDKNKAPAVAPANAPPVQLIRRAIEEASDDSGWATLGAVGNYLTKVQPDFDPRLHGHRKLSDLLRSSPAQFAVEARDTASGKKVLYVRAAG
jgi:NYN domain/OST-HTH/LOTUS domain